MAKAGPHLERLLAVAASPRALAFGGLRDYEGATTSRVHLLPHGKGKPSFFEIEGAATALAFASADLLLVGTSTGRVLGFAAGSGAGTSAVLDIDLAVPPGVAVVVTAIAVRATEPSLAVTTSGGAVHLLTLAMRDARPEVRSAARRTAGQRALTAVVFDAAGLLVFGGDDGLWSLPLSGFEIAPLHSMITGGEGGVTSLVSLDDGRVAIGHGDGSIRLCYLVGEVDAQDRSGEHAHVGAVRGLLLGPARAAVPGAADLRRLFSVGDDGAIKAWEYDNKRRPRTVDLAAGTPSAMAVLAGPVRGAEAAAGQLFVATRARKLVTLLLGAESELPATWEVLDSEFDRLAADLAEQKPKAQQSRAAAVKALEVLGEDDARQLLDGVVTGDSAPELRSAAIAAIEHGRRMRSRPVLRQALAAQWKGVRAAAFAALLHLDREQPLAVIRAGLDAAAEDVRALAVDGLSELSGASALAMATDALRDASPDVRARALRCVTALSARVDTDPLAAARIALARGPGDIQLAAILDVAVRQRNTSEAARHLVLGYLDDVDAAVRTGAFMSALVQRPGLHAALGDDPAMIGYFLGFEERVGKVEVPPKQALQEEDLQPLFAAMACRNADAALRGAAALVAIGDARAVGAILQLSRESDSGLRRLAVAALAAAQKMFPDDDRLDARLAWLLDDADALVRASAFSTLDTIAKAQSPAAQLALAELALRSSQEDIRVRALQILIEHGRIPQAGDLGARLLGDALDDEAEKVRNEAFRTLWAWNSAQPEIPLTRGARSRHADLRKQVIAEIERRRDGKQSTPGLDALLLGLVGDAVAEVGLAAFRALIKPEGEQARLDIHLAALRSPAAAVRAAGAATIAANPQIKDDAAKQALDPLLAALLALIKDDQPLVHLAAIEALDAVAPAHAEGFALAFASSFYELQVRAAELCGRRRDGRALAPCQRLLSIARPDPDRPADALRQRAARAFADVGEPAAIAFAVGLLADDDAIVREMAARALATACGPGREQPLIDALAHADLPVRSWAAEGLAKIGDLRALPVLAGTQRHSHRPLRIGAILGFVALGPDGVRGLRQGLEDPDREVRDIAFAIIVARDAALAKARLPPDLLFDALSAPSPELRFAGARLLEARALGAVIDADEMIGPRKPDKAAEIKSWPTEPRRKALLLALADSIASDEPLRRYAAAQVLSLRTQPLTFWKEAARLAGPSSQLVPHTNWSTEARQPRKSGWLRRLSKTTAAAQSAQAQTAAASELERVLQIVSAVGGPAPQPVPARAGAIDGDAVRRLVFGVYAGLIRQAPGRGDADETHRVRRDALARLVELAADRAIGRHAVLPALRHALIDPHHLVRAAAMSGLRAMYPSGAIEPLAEAIASAADVGSAAIDELLALALAGSQDARTLLHRALDVDDSAVRQHAAQQLVRLYPAGSVEPHLVAARSKHSDVRQEAVSELLDLDQSDRGNTDRPEVTEALTLALASDDVELRLQAAEALAERGDPRGVDVLAALLRDEEHVDAAIDALETLGCKPAGAAASALALAARLEQDSDRALDRERVFDALAAIGHEAAVPTLLALIHEAAVEGRAEEQAQSRRQAVVALLQISIVRGGKPRLLRDGRVRARRRDAVALPWFADALRSADSAVRVKIAAALGDVDDRGAEALLEKLLADRESEVRIAACEALALRAWCEPSASLAPLEAALRAGRRELVLPAAEGMARRGRPEAFEPLVLVLKAGEVPERERALLALGSLGDARVLEFILPLLDPSNEDAIERALAPAALESLGRLLPALERALPTDVEVDVAAIRLRVERAAQTGSGELRQRAILGLRMAGDDRSRVVIESLVSDRDVAVPVRAFALDQLGQLANAASEAVLIDALGDPQWNICTRAYKALQRVFSSDPTRVALLALSSSRTDLSDPAARYLAIKGEPAALIARFGDIKSDAVRRRLREGLARRAAWAPSALVAALAARPPEPRIEAAWLAGATVSATAEDRSAIVAAVLGAIDRAATGWSQAREAVRAKKASPDLPEREASAWLAALWAARQLRADIDAVALRALADTAVPSSVRQEAIAALIERGSEANRSALEGAIRDPDSRVRSLAARSIARTVGASGEALVRALGDQLDPIAVGPVVAAVFAAVGGEMLAATSTRSSAVTVALTHRCIAGLIASAQASGAAPARLVAIAALGRLGGEQASAVLERILGNKAEPAEVRAAAFRALKRLQRAATDRYAGQDRERGRKAAAGAQGGDDDDDNASDDDDGDDDGDDDDDDDDGADDDDDDDDNASDDDDDSDDDNASDDGDEDDDSDEEEEEDDDE